MMGFNLLFPLLLCLKSSPLLMKSWSLLKSNPLLKSLSLLPLLHPCKRLSQQAPESVSAVLVHMLLFKLETVYSM